MKTSGKKSETTRSKILKAATEVFAERGFRDATTRLICKRAGVNGALVNYHFHSKHNLYREVTFALFEKYCPDIKVIDRVQDEESWKSAVFQWVKKILILCASETPPLCYVTRLMGREADLPEDILKEIEESLFTPLRDTFVKLLKFADSDLDDTRLNLCTSSVHAQCIAYAFNKPVWRKTYCPTGIKQEKWFNLVAGYISEGIFMRIPFKGDVL